jgi:hypothetical protein
VVLGDVFNIQQPFFAKRFKLLKARFRPYEPKIYFNLSLWENIGDLLLHECYKGSDDNGAFDGEGDEYTKVSVVLAEEDKHGFVEDVYIAEGVLLRAFSFVVEDGGGEVKILKSTLYDTVRKVDVLTVHVEVFIKTSAL